jgi:hypothetical protein
VEILLVHHRSHGHHLSDHLYLDLELTYREDSYVLAQPARRSLAEYRKAGKSACSTFKLRPRKRLSFKTRA